MRLIDTHVHLNHHDLYSQIEAVIARAEAVGVEKFIVIGYDFDSSKRAIELSERYDQVFAVIGVHPTEVLLSQGIESLLPHNKVVAIGEIGLDYHWDTVPPEVQAIYFQQQIELADRFGLPIVIHMREATEDTIKILQKNRNILHQGIMHAYSGSIESMRTFVDLGFYIGLGGPVTFKNAVSPKEVAQYVPLDRLVLETDSPYLTPHPFRGKVNESSYLPLIASAIAQEKKMLVEELAEATSINAERLFKL